MESATSPSISGFGQQNNPKILAWEPLQAPQTWPAAAQTRQLSTRAAGYLKARLGIQQRPSVVDKRKGLSDIEVDLMVGKAYKSALLDLTDRATLLTKSPS